MLYIVSTSDRHNKSEKQERDSLHYMTDRETDTVAEYMGTERRTQYIGEQNCSLILTSALHSGLEHNESTLEYGA